jgi:hypothetical protein
MNERFMKAKETYFSSIPSHHYIFEVTKCCGYFEWIIIPKNYNCTDLYRYIREIYTTPNIKLYALDPFGNKLEIVESMCVIKSLLFANGTFFKPIYDLPNQVVYKLYLDDGHCHNH